MFHIIFLSVLIIAMFEDCRFLEVKDSTMGVLFVLAFLHMIFYGIKIDSAHILVWVGILLIFFMGVIAEGDAKIFLISTLMVNPKNVALAILVSLVFLVTRKRESRRSIPILTIFVPTLVLLELLELLL